MPAWKAWSYGWSTKSCPLFNFYKSSKTCDLGRWTDIKAAVQVSQAFVNHHCYSASKLSVLIIRCVQESSRGGHLDNWWENWEPPSCAHWQRGRLWTMGEKNFDLTKHFPPLMCALVQPGLRYIQLSRMDGGRNNAVKPTSSRWQNLPGSTGEWTWSHFDPAAHFNQSIRWQQAGEGPRVQGDPAPHSDSDLRKKDLV